ncbi:MAG TPA: hypothetical protein VNJ31_07470 [Methyloceanibacter sp.]|nr:hypothetical protein [Methyloceanibacter sp.]
MADRSKAVLIACMPALLLLAAPAAVAAPVCGAWGASTSQGKKEKTINGVKHICDASSRSRSCCEYGSQSKCWNETQTTYENCTPAAATAPGKQQGIRAKDLPSTMQQEETTPKLQPNAIPKGNLQKAE